MREFINWKNFKNYYVEKHGEDVMRYFFVFMKQITGVFVQGGEFEWPRTRKWVLLSKRRCTLSPEILSNPSQGNSRPSRTQGYLSRIGISLSLHSYGGKRTTPQSRMHYDLANGQGIQKSHDWLHWEKEGIHDTLYDRQNLYHQPWIHLGHQGFRNFFNLFSLLKSRDNSLRVNPWSRKVNHPIQSHRRFIWIGNKEQPTCQLTFMRMMMGSGIALLLRSCRDKTRLNQSWRLESIFIIDFIDFTSKQYI